jgi:arsenate reductase
VYYLFLSHRDAERSQIAAALARQMFGAGLRVESAGIEAAPLHPMTIETMQEINIDIRGASPKTVDTLDLSGLTLAVVIESRDIAPPLPSGVKKLHWPLMSPLDPPTSDQAVLRARFVDVRTAISKHLKMLGKMKV